MLSCARLPRREWLRFAILLAGVSASVEARADDPSAATTSPTETTDSFLADDGSRRSFDPSYREYYRAGRREPHYLRAAVEMVVLLGIGTGFYYASDNRWRGGDYPDAATRFQNLRISFDTNTFNIDAFSHPFAGTMYHWFSRTNGLSIPASFLYATLSSATWEFLLEIPERPSINDMIITPTAGLAFGEVFVHAGDYFNSTPGEPRWHQDLLGLLFGLPHRVHRSLDGYKRLSSSLPVDRLGYSTFYSHRFDLLVGPTRLANDVGDATTAAQLRLNAEIVSIPGFLRPGRFGVTFSDGEFVELLAQLFLGKDTSAGDVVADANLFGRYAQNISDGTRSGVASMLAFNTSARYTNRTVLGRRDNYFMSHLAGPAIKLWAMHGDFVARFDATAHVDLALVRSLAFPEHERLYTDAGAASPLRINDYYFAGGGSALARGRLSYKALELGARVFLGWYESIDSWDGFVPHPIHTSDRIAEFEGWAGIVPPDFPVQVRAFFEHIPRSSKMATIHTTQWDERFGIAVGGNL